MDKPDMDSGEARFMKLALAEARAAAAEGNPPYGAVIAHGGGIIARGHNLMVTDFDPSAHGEIVAIRNACRSLRTLTLDGCDLYTTCEPCLMCTAATWWVRIKRVFIGAAWADLPGRFHPEKGSLLGMAAHLQYPFEYRVGLLRDECVKLYLEGD